VDCDDNDPETFPGAPEICDGTDNDCDGLVDEDNSLVVDAGECAVVYYGYEPFESTELVASISGGTDPYTVEWIGIGTTPSVSVSPTETTTYSLIVTDAEGCSAYDDVTVDVVDVHCGKKNNKVLICQNPNNPHTICVSKNSVPAHLAQGATLGPCGVDPCNEPVSQMSFNNLSIDYTFFNVSRTDNEIEELLTAYPNPTTGDLRLALKGEHIESVRILNMFGGVLEYIENNAENKSQINISLIDLNPATYILQVESENGNFYTKRIIMIE
jgi:hypothetical protein